MSKRVLQLLRNFAPSDARELVNAVCRCALVRGRLWLAEPVRILRNVGAPIIVRMDLDATMYSVYTLGRDAGVQAHTLRYIKILIKPYKGLVARLKTR